MAVGSTAPCMRRGHWLARFSPLVFASQPVGYTAKTVIQGTLPDSTSFGYHVIQPIAYDAPSSPLRPTAHVRQKLFVLPLSGYLAYHLAGVCISGLG